MCLNLNFGKILASISKNMMNPRSNENANIVPHQE